MFDGAQNPVVALLKQHGFFGLAGQDGCLCGNCEVHGVEIGVSCRKSNGGLGGDFYGTVIRVTSSHMDSRPEALVSVAEEMVEQIWPESNRLPLVVRFSTWAQDHEQKCCYCEKPKSQAEAYLCEACEVGGDPFGRPIRSQFAFPEIRREPDHDDPPSPKQDHPMGLRPEDRP